MPYDFTSIMDRHNMDAIAVDLPGTPGFSITAPKEGFDVIPMWVADMNFPTVPTIPEAIIQRTQHTAYGYFSPRAEYFDAIIKWHAEHNGVEGMESKHIGYANGVLGGVVAAANVLCSKGDNILVHSPTYVGFEAYLGESYIDGLVVESKNIITAKGPGLSSDFAFCIIEKMAGSEVADQVYDAAQY